MPDESLVAPASTLPPQLEYGPPRRIRTRWVRLGILVVIALIVAALMPRMWTEFGRRVGRRAMQRAFMTHSAPPGTLAYAEGSDAGQLTLSQWTQYLPETGAVGARARQSEFWQVHWNLPQYVPTQEATLFLHERTSPGGTQRIVGVAAFADVSHFSADTGAVPIGFRLASAEVISFMRSSGAAPQVWHGRTALGRWPGGSTRTSFYVGQPDPHDASRSRSATRSVTGSARSRESSTTTRP